MLITGDSLPGILVYICGDNMGQSFISEHAGVVTRSGIATARTNGPPDHDSSSQSPLGMENVWSIDIFTNIHKL